MKIWINENIYEMKKYKYEYMNNWKNESMDKRINK